MNIQWEQVETGKIPIPQDKNFLGSDIYVAISSLFNCTYNRHLRKLKIESILIHKLSITYPCSLFPVPSFLERSNLNIVRVISCPVEYLHFGRRKGEDRRDKVFLSLDS